MNSDKIKHNIIKYLCDKSNHGHRAMFKIEEFPLGMSVDEMDLHIQELLESNELVITNVASKEKSGAYYAITSKGMASFSNKKYINRYKSKNWVIIKNWSQTIIPFFAVGISAISLIVVLEETSSKHKAETQKQIEELEQRLIHMDSIQKGYRTNLGSIPSTIVLE